MTSTIVRESVNAKSAARKLRSPNMAGTVRRLANARNLARVLAGRALALPNAALASAVAVCWSSVFMQPENGAYVLQKAVVSLKQNAELLTDRGTPHPGSDAVSVQLPITLVADP
jgi:hypothetical protein